MKNGNKKIAGIGIAIVFVVIAGFSMGCIDEEAVNEDITALEAQIIAMQKQIEDAEDKATEQAFLDMIAELQAEIAELQAADELPTSYIIVKRTTTEFNESFSAWGICGRTEHHTKAKALERAEDRADELSLEEDITDIKVTYDGREREYVHNGSYCYMTYFYVVEWVENEYSDQIVYLY